MSDNRLNTVGEISRKLNVPQHRVAYVIRSRNIEPSHRAANLRVFDEAAVKMIDSELRRDPQPQN